LNTKELGLGTELTIEYIEAFDQNMSVKYGVDKHEVFSKVVCDSLLIEKK
jgi:DtxR family Mn-dependent transcriptional regulator